MKLDLTIVIKILQAILCDPTIMAWLEAEAKKTETPIDDMALTMIKMMLCPKA